MTGEKKGKKIKFSLYLGVKISFWKGGGGKNINYLDNIHPWRDGAHYIVFHHFPQQFILLKMLHNQHHLK